MHEAEKVTPREAAKHLLNNSDDQTILIGPMVERPEFGSYCIAVSAKNGKAYIGQFIIPDDSYYRDFVSAFMGLPVVVFVTGDELELVELAEGLWPGEEISNIRRQIEQEKHRAR